MKIRGRREEYDCCWSSHGWSYAAVNIYARRKFLGFLWTRWKLVKTFSNGWSRKSFEEAYSDFLKEKFIYAVSKYEYYLDAWELETKENTTE